MSSHPIDCVFLRNLVLTHDSIEISITVSAYPKAESISIARIFLISLSPIASSPQ
jgi:hypothetical protein